MKNFFSFIQEKMIKKTQYILEKKCDGCKATRMTREVKNLDPKRKNITNFLCYSCDNSYNTIPKILKWNKENLRETNTIFGHKIEKNGSLKIE